MRILFVSRCPPYPLYLGDRLILYHLAEELEARKHTLDLLAFVNRAADWNEIGHYDHLFDRVDLFSEPRRTPLTYLRRRLVPGTRFPQRADQAWAAELWRAIERRLSEQRYDLVHLFGSVQVYEFAAALGHTPVLITPYESYSLYLRRQFAQSASLASRLQLWMARSMEGWMFNPYPRVVVVSEPDRAELLALNPRLKIAVIPNGVNIHEFRPRPTPREAGVLLFTGNYEYAPNVDAALRLATEILPAVRARIPHAVLWLVGNAPPPELQALASETIKVTGRVPDIKPYLARAAAFVSPLRFGAGIKNKVLEALAMGCPVVATPLSVDGIAVAPDHDAVIADDAHFTDAVIRVLSDDALREGLSRHAADLITAQYSWDHTAEAYLDLYRELLGSRDSAE